ncbi:MULTISPECIES: capsular polysaccharide biosynthesis protein CapF [unclassified Mesobacillus]|uniref:capsular polysaccharide biosynthesis protein CapF n=1 Tax=unclassified Mesobacillus TaxID=2675270 RepID=UPI00203C4963|nr:MULTISPECIES: capsular polysaccharide biosynthesis protein CapF [unclassified Mesobacillus]MCM3124170.1 capsular polysaccharide biosynthesis protein CapF [Mesobacillus sp. MER 33]MCM3234019.1 capsular polysaccharide biosynthesis protein CapF [Mesobacillus sp. MER 48]
MRILITGAKGFIGKNLIAELKNRGYTEIYEYGRDSNPALLDKFCKEADFVYHLAGVNRPNSPSEFMEGNFESTSALLETLKKYNNTCPVLISSSIQASLDNPYGVSKKAGEELLFKYSKETCAKVLVYRLPNVFGKWCKPNYNSAVATFCHKIAHDLPITLSDPNVVMNLVYIDDVVEQLINALIGKENRVGDFCIIPVVHTITLGSIAELIYSFKNSRDERTIPDMSDAFTKKLYSTYLSYLPENHFNYELKMNVDDRGSFTEFIKTPERGQVSVNISKPGITKGNHWHHTKNEKFLVVSGNGVIRFRKLGSEEVIEYYVSGEKLEVVDIPTGYTHNIENLGQTDMVTIMWANEQFDSEKPDTYYLEV